MISRRRLALLLALCFLTGCATYASPPPTASTPPRTRCLSNPSETALRPMIFLFCVESP